MAERFDGDYNVLFHTLAETTLNGEPVLNRMRKALASASGRMTAETAMNAFINIDGQSFYPQIYIPFFEELQADGRIGQSDPVLVIHPGDDAVTEVPGYRLGTNNELLPTGQIIDEQFARQNEVWVLSLNERITMAGLQDHQKNAREKAVPEFQIERLRLREHMEGWLSGENDVRFTGVMNFNNGTNPYTGQPQNGEALCYEDGLPVVKFSRKEVNSQTTKTVNRTIVQVVNTTYPESQNGCGFSPSKGNFMWFVVFEFDAWPESTKYRVLYSPAGHPLTIGFRSKDGPCDENVISIDPNYSPYAGTYSAVTNRVIYNMKRIN